jgi:ribonuclease HIII
MDEEKIKELRNKIKDVRDCKLQRNYSEKRYNEGYSAGYEQGIIDALDTMQNYFEVQADEQDG